LFIGLIFKSADSSFNGAVSQRKDIEIGCRLGFSVLNGKHPDSEDRKKTVEKVPGWLTILRMSQELKPDPE
jgi:hypothetical protein